MKAFEAICLKDWAIEAQNGDRLELKRGKAYTVGAAREETVMVFSKFWVRVPISIFEPAATWRVF